MVLLSMLVFSIIYITLVRAGTLRTLKCALLLFLSTSLAVAPTMADMHSGLYPDIAGSTSDGEYTPYVLSADQHEPYQQPFLTVAHMLKITPAQSRRSMPSKGTLMLSESTLRHMSPHNDQQITVVEGPVNTKQKNLAMSDDALLANSPIEPEAVLGAALPASRSDTPSGSLVSEVQPVLFGFDKSDLSETALGQLLPLVEQLRATPDLRVTLTGHTDSIGTEQYNQLLSVRRAEAVRLFLLQQGIDRKMIRVLGVGEKRPAKSNAKPSGRKANRRVAIVVN